MTTGGVWKVFKRLFGGSTESSPPSQKSSNELKPTEIPKTTVKETNTPKVVRMKAPAPPRPGQAKNTKVSENNQNQPILSEMSALEIKIEKTDDNQKLNYENGTESAILVGSQQDLFTETQNTPSLTQNEDDSLHKISKEENQPELQAAIIDPLNERLNALIGGSKSENQLKMQNKRNITEESPILKKVSRKGIAEVVPETCAHSDNQQVSPHHAAIDWDELHQKSENMSQWNSGGSTVEQIEDTRQIILPLHDEEVTGSQFRSIQDSNHNENVASLDNNEMKSPVAPKSSNRDSHDAKNNETNTNLLTENAVVAPSSYCDQVAENLKTNNQCRTIKVDNQNTTIINIPEHSSSLNDFNALPKCSETKYHKQTSTEAQNIQVAKDEENSSNHDKVKSSTLPEFHKTNQRACTETANTIQLVKGGEKSSSLNSNKKKYATLPKFTKTIKSSASFTKPAPLPKPTQFSSQTTVHPKNQPHKPILDQITTKTVPSSNQHISHTSEEETTITDTPPSNQETPSAGQDEVVQNIIGKIKSVQQEVADLANEIDEFCEITSNHRNYEYLDECLMRSLIKLDNCDIGSSQEAREERKKGIRFIQGMLNKLDVKLKANQKKAKEAVSSSSIDEEKNDTICNETEGEKATEAGQQEESLKTSIS